MPVVFAAHGAPILVDDAEWSGQLAAWAKALPRPKNILMISAHWERNPLAIGAVHPVPLVYDFYGFPERYYQATYPAPGAPELAARVRDLLAAAGTPFQEDHERGLDHGAYVPLMIMYPEADVPVLQISMPALDPFALYNLGAILAPLRAAGTLIFGSGFLTHNMGYAFRPGIPDWAMWFDQWAAGALERMDIGALLDFQSKAPAALLALPTWEHYAPLLVALGAAVGDGTKEGVKVTFPITGFWMKGAFTKRSVQFG